MDKEIKERVVEIINSTKKTRIEFAQNLDMTPGHLSVVLNTENKMVSANMYKALAKLGVNMTWLFTGEGTMWRTDPETSPKIVQQLTDANNLIDSLERILKGIK
mgnify:FL=1